MKSMEEYINDVYEKYEETEKNHKIYKTVRMKYHNPLTTLCSVAACLLLVCIFGVGINFLKTEEELKNNYVEAEVKNDGKIIYTKYLKAENIGIKDFYKKLIARSDVIAVVSNNCVIGWEYENKNEQFILKTRGYLKANNVIKGNLYSKDNIFMYLKPCGVISLLELEKNDTYDWEDWELVNIGHIVPKDEKAITYFRQIPSTGIEFEDDKQYLVFFEYDEENNIYNIIDFAYGILEYDPTTNKVKNIDTGEFEDFDWDLINEKMDEE